MHTCPCGSGKNYDDCCKRYHDGAFAENALILMRSRYSGYALSKVDYILDTAHPLQKDTLENPVLRKKEVLWFCQNTLFKKLEILEFIDGKEEAFVTFIASLEQSHQDVSFTEKSRFDKCNGRWFYRDGKVLRGRRSLQDFL
jgi:SEC-C motif-containing protein